MNPEISKFISYNKDSGEFTWRIPTGKRVRAGSVAGTITKQGYRAIFFKGQKIRAHKLAWFLVYGETPKLLDHINRDRSDNRISNLRITDPCSNQWNTGIRGSNACGAKNIAYFPKRNSPKKYWGGFKKRGKLISAGYFKTLEEAIVETSRLREIHHGEFANHGQHAIPSCGIDRKSIKEAQKELESRGL